MSVDNRVVKMEFDNSRFEKNVQQTMSSLDRLKQSLNFSRGKDSMTELSAAAGKVNMSPIGTQIEGVNTKFLAMATIAVTALSNIAAKAAQVGAGIAKSLTIGPLIDGFQEYETNMNSIQTILANTKSKGSTLEDVEAALQNLNEYSDQTIYNFGEMARNIGTFTAAGVDLDASTNAIKGIANLAAISGSNSQQASSAMYQLSQALAAGKVGLIDWNSVVNAGMGGEVFKSALFETAKAMGTIADVPIDQSLGDWEKAGNSFRDSLQDGWITADVLSNTLQGFTGDLNDEQLRAIGYNDIQIQQFKELGKLGVESATKVKTFTQLIGTVKEAIGTGWADSFKLVVGDFEQARELFTGINNYLGKYISGTATARNNLLQGWKAFGGRDALLQSLMFGLSAIESVLKPIKDAFREVFPPTTAATLIDLTNRLRDFMKGLILSEESAAKVKRIFTGVFSVFKIGVEIVKGLFSTFRTLASTVFGIIASFSGAAGQTSDFVVRLREMLVEGGGIKNVFETINAAIVRFGEFVLAGKERVADFIGGLKEGAGESAGFQKVVESLSRFFEKLKASGGSVKEVFETIKDSINDFFAAVKEKFGGAGDTAGAGLSGFIDRLSDAISPETFEKVFTVIGTGLLAGITVLLGYFAKNGIGLDLFSDLVDNASGAFENLGKALSSFTANQRSDLLMKIAIAVGVLTASLVILSLIDPAKLGKALGALAIGMGVLVGVLAVFTKITVKPFQFASLAGSMVLISVAALLLAAAIKVLSTMSWAELAKGLAGVTGAMLIMAGAAAVLSKVNGSFIRAGVSLIVLSGALLIFAGVIKLYSTIPFDEVKDGLLRIGLALGMFALFTRVVDEKGIVRVAIGLIGLSAALLIMTKVVERFGNLKINELRQGLISVGLILAGFAIFLKVMPDGASTLAKAAGLLIMAGALFVMAEVVKTLGALDIASLGKGLVAIGLLLVGVVVAANAMNGSLVGAAAIVILAGALHVMAGVLERVGNLGLETVLVGLLGIAGVLLILGGAAAALTAFPPLLAALTAMASALLMVGAGFALMGAGVYLAARGLEIFVNLGEKAGEAILDMLRALSSAIPEIAAATAGGFIMFITTIAEKAEPLIDAIGDIIITLVDKLIELMPKLGELINSLFTETILILEEQVPRIIEVGILILTSLLTGIRDNIELLTTIGFEILSNFISGLIIGIPLLAPKIRDLIQVIVDQFVLNIQLFINAGVSILVGLLNGIASAIPQIATAVGNVITAFITALGNEATRIVWAGMAALLSFAGGLAAAIGVFVETAVTIIDELIDKLVDESLRLVDVGIDATITFLDGMVDRSIDFINRAAKVVLKLLNGIEAAIRRYSPEFRRAALGIADAIIDGITGGLSDKVGDVLASAQNIGGQIIDGIKGVLWSNSPSKVMIQVGKDVGNGLAIGLGQDARVKDASKALAASTISAFGAAMSGLSSDLATMDEFNPTITPVLDLTRLNKDAQGISGAFGSTSISADLSTRQARYLSAAQANAQTVQEVTAVSGPTEIKFEQTINSPVALSTEDIYRSTRSQITLAKEELGLL